MHGNRSKAPDKKPPGQKPPDNKLTRINEEIIAKYAVDTNLFRLGSSIKKHAGSKGAAPVEGGRRRMEEAGQALRKKLEKKFEIFYNI